jgi:hypothetical protein
VIYTHGPYPNGLPDFAEGGHAAGFIGTAGSERETRTLPAMWARQSPVACTSACAQRLPERELGLHLSPN